MEEAREIATYWTLTLVSFCAFYAIMEVLASKVFGHLIPAHYSAFSASSKKIVGSGLASSVNSLIMFPSSLYLITHYDLHKDPWWYDSFPVRLLCCIEVGYFIADMMSVLGTSALPGKYLFIVHHAVIISGIYFVVVHKVFAFFVCLRGLNEVTIPFVRGRWLLARIEKKGDTSYAINGVLIMLTFFLGRICVIPIFLRTLYFTLGTSQYERVSLLCKAILLGGSVVIDALNIYWFGLITKGAYSLFKSKFGKGKLE